MLFSLCFFFLLSFALVYVAFYYLSLEGENSCRNLDFASLSGKITADSEVEEISVIVSSYIRVLCLTAQSYYISIH